MQELLTESEAASMMRLKVKTLQAWRLQKRGPRYAKLGSRVFYPRVEIERFIEESLTPVSGSTEGSR